MPARKPGSTAAKIRKDGGSQIPPIDFSYVLDRVPRGLIERLRALAIGFLNGRGAILIRGAVGAGLALAVTAAVAEAPFLAALLDFDQEKVITAITGAIIACLDWLLRYQAVDEVKEVQDSLNLKPDGYVGPVTAEALREVTRDLYQVAEAAEAAGVDSQ